MPRVASFSLRRRKCGDPSFTLVELLTVMLVIAILVGITLMVVKPAMNAAAQARARGEIQALSSGLDYYKTDNGIYPNGYIGTNATTGLLGGSSNGSSYPADPSSTNLNYQVSSQALYEALAGKTNYADTPVGKSYMTFKTSQLGNYATTPGTIYAASSATYIADPWGYSYGYSTGDGTPVNVPCSGSNFFDLWSTGGVTGDTIVGTTTMYATNTWIANWRN